MDTWKMVKAAMPGPPCWETDWEILSSCGLTGFFGEMERTMQNPRWHGEKDVMTHTRMVCDALAGLEEFRSLSEKVRHEVFLAALLHDIGKIPCTRLEDGQWTSPNHGRVGSRMAGMGDGRGSGSSVPSRVRLPADLVPYGSRPYSEAEGRGKNIDPDQRLGGGGAGLFP